MQQDKIRNLAIIAHVDHGKTTLVDAMLKQTATFAAHRQENQQTTILDSNELERERGVTILAKNTAVFWHDYKLNILDTPGHADFSGEVERVLSMADGCILLVDAAEGVLSQTKFVLRLALELGLIPLVLINKVDRKDQRVQEVEAEVADLFLELATDEAQLDFPVFYGRGLEGIAGLQLEENPDHSLRITDSTDLSPLFESLVDRIPAPSGDPEGPLQLQVNALDSDPHLGSIIIGRIFRGRVRPGMSVLQLKRDGSKAQARVERVFVQRGLEREAVEEAAAGEIVALSGISQPQIGETLADPAQPEALPALAISEPTVKMQLSVNSSPFAGREAEYCTSRQLRARLDKELETNVGLRLLPGSSGESMTLVGRGELHLSILIETMRREQYEFALSRPEVLLKEIDGRTQEPWEELFVEVPESLTGAITGTMAKRLATLVDMRQDRGRVRFRYELSTANLIGFRSELLVLSSGEAVADSSFLGYRPLSKRAETHRGGAIIAQETGKATAYALDKAQQRGKMLVDPGDEVYAGQVVGINSRGDDMRMNVVKGKKLTNMRASGSDGSVILAPAWRPSLEQFLTLIGEDEMLEVTPLHLRLRKKSL